MLHLQLVFEKLFMSVKGYTFLTRDNSDVKKLLNIIQTIVPESNDMKMIIRYVCLESIDFPVGFPPKNAMNEVQSADKNSEISIEPLQQNTTNFNVAVEKDIIPITIQTLIVNGEKNNLRSTLSAASKEGV